MPSGRTAVGIQLPLNFNSPLRALNVVDYWRRWHMTCRAGCATTSTSRSAEPLQHRRIYFNLMVTMALSGLWHGAPAFVLWVATGGAMS